MHPSLKTLSWGFTNLTWTQRLDTVLPGVLVVVVALWLCVTIRWFTFLVQRGRALSAGVHRLLVQLGTALIFLTAAFLISEIVANMLIYTGLPTRGIGFAILTISVGDFVPLGVALVILIVAYAWRQGEQLAEDAETMI